MSDLRSLWGLAASTVATHARMVRFYEGTALRLQREDAEYSVFYQMGVNHVGFCDIGYIAKTDHFKKFTVTEQEYNLLFLESLKC